VKLPLTITRSGNHGSRSTHFETSGWS
jgi:hypothetical protein